MERINALYNDRWTLLNLFQEGLRKNPTLSAVRFDDGYQIVEMNYLRLNEESNAVANKLNDFHLENEMIGLSAHMNGSVISVMLGYVGSMSFDMLRVTVVFHEAALYVGF